MQQRVDWFRILDDLKRQGVSLYALEAQVEIPRSTLIRYKDGTEPSYHNGERLVGIWCQVTGNDRCAIPVAAVGLSAYRAK
jgi:lambda repressor-like predicted transcriptional regulator